MDQPGKRNDQIGAVHLGRPWRLFCRQADVRVEHADTVQINAALPPQGQSALPQPDALAPVAHDAARQQEPEKQRREQQGDRECGQGVAGDETEQGTERKRDARRNKEDEASLFGAGQKVRRHPELRKQLPEHGFVAGTVNKQRQFRRTAPRRDKDRPAPQKPRGGGDADIGKADLVGADPAFEPVQPAAPAADLVRRVPDLIVDRLHEAADQAQPQQKARKSQQPRRASREPPRGQSGQKVDLRKGQRVGIRAMPSLPDGQQEEGQRRKAVGPQQAQRGSLAALGPVEAGGFHRQQLVGQLCGIAFGCLLSNLSYFVAVGGTNAMYHPELWADFLNEASPYYHSYGHILANAGLLDVFYIGVKAGIYPSLIFMGVGAMTDFGPMIANPKSMLMGASAQLGVFVAFFGAVMLGFTGPQSASIGIIGGADGPTAIYLTTKLAPELLGPIAIAAYSYMALIPLIQPPLMKLFTTEEMRRVKMEQSREVSKTEKIVFPMVVSAFVILLLPSTAPLIGCLMLGNLFRECGVTDRLSDTAQNALMNIITIFLSTSVGATMSGENFLSLDTIKIILLGLVAFGISTVGGLLGGVVMYYASGKKINPLIGSAGVSAVPMAARVSQDVGRKYNKTNFLLMHAMGPNVAGVIGSAIAAGFLLSVFGG